MPLSNHLISFSRSTSRLFPPVHIRIHSNGRSFSSIRNYIRIVSTSRDGAKRIVTMSGVQEYIDKYNIKETVESAINACVHERSEEPLLFLAQYLEAKVKDRS